ncbi:MAG: EamA family transporter [Cyclobacteriaceae bacterium]|nr:EamA family transporter [Cyclobacteriaceae bacterium]
MQTSVRYFITGISFALLWASASVAGKFGLKSSEPLTLFTVRFFLAGILLLLIVRFSSRRFWPQGREWLHLTIFSLLNTALYLGIFIIALQEVAAGITALALALNPLLISTFSSLWLKRPVLIREWISIVLGMVGVGIATWPLLQNGYATVFGLSLLMLSMVMYSLGAVYYSSVSWTLSRTVINGWQVLIAGFLLLPFTLFFEGGNTSFDVRFWLSVAWLVIPVSIGAVQLWLSLLKEDPVHASLWLFLCPVFGIAYSWLLLNEPFTLYTLFGTILVMISLYEGQRRRITEERKKT